MGQKNCFIGAALLMRAVDTVSEKDSIDYVISIFGRMQPWQNIWIRSQYLPAH
jgi:hypothetical protein